MWQWNVIKVFVEEKRERAKRINLKQWDLEYLLWKDLKFMEKWHKATILL